MALRRVVDDVEIHKGLFVAETHVTVPLKGQCGQVGFRAGAGMGEVVDVLKDYDYVTVDAAVGAGKSTRLPKLLADNMGLPVYHVVPSVYLAVDLAGYLQRQGPGYTLVDHVDVVASGQGVNLIPASVLVAKWMRAGELKMSDCVIYHDESHESDAYSYFVSKIWTAVEGVRKYVSATATSSPSGHRKAELPSEVTAATHPGCADTVTWDVLGEQGLPWEVNQMTGNMLIFEEDHEKSARLVAQYSKAGAQAFHLHGRMKIKAFETAMQILRNSKRGYVVLVADNTFRSGFTWPVRTVIDTCLVSSIAPGHQGPERFDRRAFEFEVYQGAARAGRVKGPPVVTWTPGWELERRMSVLEPSEVDAAALLFRIFGKLAPRELVSSPALVGPVPRDIIAALRGQMPLACMHPTQLVNFTDLSDESGRRSPNLRPEWQNMPRRADTHYMGTSADKAIELEKQYLEHRRNTENASVSVESGYDYTASSSAGTVSTGRTSVSGSNVSVGHAGLVDLSRIVAADRDVAVDRLVPGGYYMSPDLAGVSVRSAIFPEGHVSVLRVLANDSTGARHLGLSFDDRAVATMALLDRFTICSVQLNALASIAADAGALGRTRGRVQVRDWLHRFVEQMGQLQAESSVMANLIATLADGRFELEQFDAQIMQPSVDEMVEMYLGEVRRINVTNQDVSGFTTSVQAGVSNLIQRRGRDSSVSSPVPQIYGAGSKRPPSSTGYTGKVPLYMQWIAGAQHNVGTAKVIGKLEAKYTRRGSVGEG